MQESPDITLSRLGQRLFVLLFRLPEILPQVSLLFIPLEPSKQDLRSAILRFPFSLPTIIPGIEQIDEN